MKKWKSLIFIVVLATVALTTCASAKSPLLLLQEGVYAEETEGDLDKAIGLYQQVIDQAGEVERLAARAAYRLGECYLKKDDKASAAKYFQSVVEKYPSQTEYVKQAKEELEKIAPETKKSIFEQVDGQVLRFISERYGEFASEANGKSLATNCQIYYVDPSLELTQGGIGAYYNWTGQTVKDKVRLTGTSCPNQTHYNVTGAEMKTVITPHKTKPNFWDIYWIPDEPIAPGESYYYGWSIDKTRKLSPVQDGTYQMTMQNKFGPPAIETFFLVLSKELNISQSNPPSGSRELLNFNVYWWSKTVQQSENHAEQIKLKTKTFADEIQIYKVDKSVADFGDDDFSTPESAYAAINRVSASGKADGWKKVSVPSLADRLPGKDSSVPQDWVEVLRNAKIAEVRIYDDKYAQVTAELLSEFSTKEIKQPFDVRHLELVDGKWLNTGNDRRNSLEETAELFEKVVQRKTEQQEEVAKKYSMALNEPISVKIEKSPDGSRLTVQYAALAIAEAAGIPYQWDKSAQLAEPQRRQYIEPLDISNKTATQALAELLGPVGLSLRVDNNGLYLYDPKKFSEVEILKSSKQDKLAAEDLVSQGWKLWGERKLAEAEELFKKAAEKDPTNDNAYQGLGWAQLNQGKKVNAQDSFEKCIELNPKNSAALNGLGWIADGQGNKEEAIKWWENAVDASNGYATASLNGLTKVYMEKGDYENAVKYYKMWLKVEPDNKDAKDGLKNAEEKKSPTNIPTLAIQQALEASRLWLSLVDNGNYPESWENAAQAFKKAVDKNQWQSSLDAVRKPLGDLIKREVYSQTYKRQTPGAPDGEYVEITYRTSFENKKDAFETVTPMLDTDGKWKVAGYYIK